MRNAIVASAILALGFPASATLSSAVDANCVYAECTEGHEDVRRSATYDRAAPEASRIADAPAPRRDLIDIVSVWPEQVREIAGRVTVPVHYRQAAQDNLWIVNEGEIAGFAAAFGFGRIFRAGKTN